MAATSYPSPARRLLIYGVGVLGFFLAMDVALIFCFLVLGFIVNGPMNHYMGIVVFLVLPPPLALGIAAMGWAGRRMADMQRLSALEEAERAYEAAIPGH
jgi:hypothetical protein